MTSLIPYEVILSKIFLIRDAKVMLDRDLAKLYGVSTGRLNEQVRRNIKRFPPDFMFRLTKQEAEILVSHFAIPSKRSLGGSLPYAFSEQGVAMLSSVLNSDRAIEVNIQIMRAFVQVRHFVLSNKDLARRVGLLEAVTGEHDSKIKSIFEVLKSFEPPVEEEREKIGFKVVRK